MPVCAIVGAGEGLGQSLAARFAGEGFDLGLISRTAAGCQAAMRAAEDARAETGVQHFPADATEPASMEQATSDLVQSFGGIDILIYNVCDGFPGCDPLDMSYADMERVFRLEVVGAFAAARAVIPMMREQGAGSVFFSSATAALRGSANYPLYCIGKFGLRALAQSLARAYARDGVHIAHIRLDCDLDLRPDPVSPADQDRIVVLLSIAGQLKQPGKAPGQRHHPR